MENILTEISLKFVPEGPIGNNMTQNMPQAINWSNVVDT